MPCGEITRRQTLSPLMSQSFDLLGVVRADGLPFPEQEHARRIFLGRRCSGRSSPQHWGSRMCSPHTSHPAPLSKQSKSTDAHLCLRPSSRASCDCRGERVLFWSFDALQQFHAPLAASPSLCPKVLTHRASRPTAFVMPQGQHLLQMMQYSAVGTPPEVASYLDEFLSHSGPMNSSVAFDTFRRRADDIDSSHRRPRRPGWRVMLECEAQ